jgi:transcriptional regulator GlxA family with amidase domain
MITIGIALFDGAEELDWAGPWEVFGMWASLHPEEAQVISLAESAGEIRCAKGVRVIADHSHDDAPDVDVVVVPGGEGTKQLLDDAGFHDRLRTWSDEGVLVTSVCTGSLVLAAAGLLDGRPATTHWGAIDKLGRLGAGVEVRPDDRFVDAGTVITAAGVSAGIDMALFVVSKLVSPSRAAEVRRAIQYDPAPPV